MRPSNVFKLPGSTPNSTSLWSSNPTSYTTTTTSTIGSYIAYIFSIFIVILAIILFIHFFITPIFQVNPGGPGVIPIPGFSDGQLLWKNTHTVEDISDSRTIIGNQTTNWSMALDMFIEEPFTMPSQSPRILFNRGGNLLSGQGGTISSIIQDYNVCIALLPDTTDMIVSIMNSDDNMENILITNVPVQTPFRVGLVIMDTIMEVYLNGMLHKTRTLEAPPKNVFGMFKPPTGDMHALAKVMNLHLWNRILTPPEMRYAKPGLPSADEFKASKMKGTGSCPTPDSMMNGVLQGASQAISNSTSHITDVMSSI
jgi:hypothetical protein